MENNLKVAAIQMISSSNYIQNLQDAAALIAQAATQGAQLVILPEFFISISDSKDFNLLAESLGNGRIQTQLSDIARNNKIYLVAGTIPILAPQINKYYNTCIVYNNTGAKICHYHKIHLFKFNNGEYNFDEGKQFIPGNQVITFEIEGFNFGLSICYDLRFPEFFRQMAGVDAIILPAAFTYQTGLAHWEVLLRARAIENQCYLIASAQGGNHSN
nr:carbon-nitrogen hydrolase family protein [Burkholderiales bacterium]